jgi:hypothetical protein
MTLKQMLYIQKTVEDADKWCTRYKSFSSMPYKNPKREQEIYTKWMDLEANLDNILESILVP